MLISIKHHDCAVGISDIFIIRMKTSNSFLMRPKIPKVVLKECIKAALTFQSVKKLTMLGV